jgi:DNA-3-methyladenine glycosylase I
MTATRVVTLVPNAAGTRQDWTLVGAESLWEAVGDGSEASYVESATDGATERFELGSHALQPGEFVSGLRVRVRAATQARHTIEVAVQVADGSGVTACGGLTDKIPQSQSIRDFTSFVFPGAGNPYAASKSARGVMSQAMLDGLNVQLALRASAAQAATSRVYEVSVELYVSDAMPRIVRKGHKLRLSSGSEARFVGVNFRTDDFHDQDAAEIKGELTSHRSKGFSLARLHIYTSRIKTAAGRDSFVSRELAKLVEILQHCNDIGMYVDLTLFAAYRRGDNPPWYEALGEAERWRERQHQARQICGMLDQHPAVAWYCLGNEFVVPADAQPFWVQDPVGRPKDLWYFEMVVKDPAGRSKATIWSDWLTNVLSDSDGARAAITDPPPLFGCGSFPLIGDETTCTPARSLQSGLRIVLVHAYPERDSPAYFGLPALLGYIRAARRAGLPCVLEELFPAPNGKGSFAEMHELLSAARGDVSGIVGHSDGLTSTDYPASGLNERDLLFRSGMRWYEQRAGRWRKEALGVGGQELRERGPTLRRTMRAVPQAPPALARGSDGARRCWWGDSSPDYERYHDDEWGRPVTDDRGIYERLTLEAFQSGLSWLTIMRKREAFRAAFADFEIEKVARFGARDVKRLMADAGIVRNRAKIDAAIANARAAAALDGSLAELVWSHAPRGRPRAPRGREDLPAVTAESTALSKELKRRGFRFLGPTTVYATMQACGVVNDHLAGCHVRGQVERERTRAKTTILARRAG